MRRSAVASLAAPMAVFALAAHAQQIQLTGPLGSAEAAPEVRDEDVRLVQLGIQGGTLARLPIGPGATHETTFVPFVGVEARLSFPWPYPGGGDLSHGVVAGFDYGQGRATTSAVRDERVALLDAAYFMAHPLRNYGPYSIMVAARTGVSVMGLWPVGVDDATPFAGGLLGAEIAIQLMDPALRFGLAGDVRALWQVEGMLGSTMQTSIGLRAGWTFVQ